MAAPDSYMPFYGKDFFQAVHRYPVGIGMGYLRAIWEYWNHTHCEGLSDNDEELRLLCVADRQEWPYVKSVIFDNDKFFTIGEDGKWHQRRAAKEWAISKEKYERACQRSASGHEGKRIKRLQKAKTGTIVPKYPRAPSIATSKTIVN